MKTAYTPDNTRSAVLVLFVIAAAIIGIVAAIGLSDKPDVSTIVIVPAAAMAQGTSASDAAAAMAAAEAASATDATDATGPSGSVLEDGDGADAADAASAAAGSADDTGDGAGDSDGGSEAGATRTPTGEIIVVPTAEPTPTPEIAAAVNPTPVPTDTDSDDAESSSTGAMAMPSTSGSVQGSFFTKSDENEGAIVTQNLITLSFAEDGSGAFQGVLEITYADDTHIVLNMSGPLTWAPTNPQVETTLSGMFTLDAPIDADDVTTTDAELSISSLAAGSGSLCTTKCFGFTFPPQT